MIRINENGDVVRGTPVGARTAAPLATAAELKAAYAERGMMVISVEDAEALFDALIIEGKKNEAAWDAAMRLKGAITEAP